MTDLAQHVINGQHTIAFYYGHGKLGALARYERAVLQPGHYSAEDLQWLRVQGTLPLAYLSLSEDPGPSAPWHKGEFNPDWGTAYVELSHPGWLERCLGVVAHSLELGFGGFFLDTLDIAYLYPEDREPMLNLIGSVHVAARGALLFSNRGFSLLPELAEWIDGLVFESFSISWGDTEGGYRMLPSDELELNSRLAHQLLSYDLELYALDYVDSSELAAFAKTRAALHGLSWFASNRALTLLPESPCPGELQL